MQSIGNFDGVGSDDIAIVADKDVFPSNFPNVFREGSAYFFSGTNPSTQLILDADTDAALVISGIDDSVRISEVRPSGDYNGNGTPEIMIHKVNDNLDGEGPVEIYEGQIGTNGLELSLVETISGTVGIRAGTIDSVGDFNNDGFDDIVGFPENGRLRVYLGHADDQSSPGTVWFTAGPKTNLGVGMGLGDINGDGIEDIGINADVQIDFDRRILIFMGRSLPSGGNLQEDIDGEYLVLGQNFGPRRSLHGDFDNDGASEISVRRARGGNIFYFHSFPRSRPVITLNGDSTVNLGIGVPYADAGATASDNEDGDITGSIVVNGLPIDTGTGGTYKVTYDVTDSDGNKAIQAVRTVNVIQTDPPSSVSGFQDGSLPNGNYGGTEDSYLVQRSPSANFGSETSIQADGVQFDPASGKYGEVAAIIKWDVSSIPASAQVSRVFVTFNYSDASSGPYNIYSQNTDWSEGSVSWDDMDPGATLLGVIPPFTFDIGPIELNPDGVALVQDWINGATPNNGLIIRTAGSNNGIRMDSSESSGFRPKLEIVFTEPTGPGPSLNKSNVYTESCGGTFSRSDVEIECFCRDTLDVPLTFKCDGPIATFLYDAGVSLDDPSGIGKATCAWRDNSVRTSSYTTEVICFNVNNN